VADYPFVPKSNAQLEPGQFWSIPLSDGRFACGRVLRIDRAASYGARTMFVGAVLDWVGDAPPTDVAIAGRPVLALGRAHVRLIGEGGGSVLGIRALEADGITVPAQINTHWGAGYPAARAERRFIKGDPPPAFERRAIRSPLTGEMLRPSTSGRGVVQFDRLLSDDDFGLLADWFRQYPEMGLRVYGSYDGSIRDLEFLRFFPFLRRFEADALYDKLTSLDGLRHLPADVEELGIGWTKQKLDLAILGRFRELKTLSIEGQTRHLDVIAGLTSLEDLTLRSITLPDLSLLLPLRRLQSLDLKLGGTKDLRLLPRVGALRYLELWLIRGLTDIAAIGHLPELRYLFLQAHKHVESLPDLSEDVALRRVHLEAMKGIRDLRPLRTAPRLEEVVLADMRHLQPADLEPLIGLPRLKAVFAGLGSQRKNRAATELLGLPSVTGQLDWREPTPG